MGKAEWGCNPVCRWLGLYFCFVCCLAQDATRGWVMPGLGFLCVSSHYSIPQMMLKLKLQYFGHLTGRADSLEKTLEGLEAGREGDNREWDGWMASPTQWTWVWVNSRSWWWTGRPGVLQIMGSQRVGHDLVIELNWTEAYFSGSLGSWSQCSHFKGSGLDLRSGMKIPQVVCYGIKWG